MLLTIDIGTSSFKSALWDLNGKRLSFYAVPLNSTSSDLKHEAECSQWLKAFEICCGMFSPEKKLKDAGAIVISGNGPTLVPVTGKPSVKKEGLTLPAENARLWLDRRAVKYQALVSELAGGFVDAGFFLPKILSIKNEEPELYQRINCFLGCPEYLAYTLTGEAKTVFPSDGFDRWFWDDLMLEKLELAKEKFPAFIRPGDLFGGLIPSVADHFGFTKNIPVISGGPDFFAAIIGAGVTEPGQACDRTGSSEGINLCTENKIDDKRLMSYAHPIKPYWNLSGIISTTGKAIRWCSDLLGISGIDDFFSLAQQSKPGSGGLVFLPYLCGERAPVWDPSLRAVWRGLSLDTGRAGLANSVLEGICFAIRDVISVMEESCKPGDSFENFSQLRVTGGLAGNTAFNRLKADITGKPVYEPCNKEAELLGLAVIGACRLGKFSSIAEASSAMVRMEKIYTPNKKNINLYDELFTEYLKMREV